MQIELLIDASKEELSEIKRMICEAFVTNELFHEFGQVIIKSHVFLRWDAHKSIDDTKNMIQQWIDSYQDDSTYYWGIYLKNGEMIGLIGITITSEYDFKGELGYKIGSRWWNKGYSSEAAKAVIDYMFRNTDIERIDSFSSVKNPASSKVMEKAGMHYEGLLQHYYKTRDGFHNCSIYGIIRNEWEQKYEVSCL